MLVNLFSDILSSYSEFFLFLASQTGSHGLATILLSAFLFMLMLYPLIWSQQAVVRELEMQKILVPQINLIKLNMTGAAAHHGLRRLYSRYSYHPLFAIRILMPLLVQLPILILTFFMFKDLEAIKGVQFLWISDLSKPDELFPFVFGNGNLLPFVILGLTLISALFTIDFSQNDFIQAAGISFFFFILLYNESSILLLFWAINSFNMLLRQIYFYFKADKERTLSFNKFWEGIAKFLNSRELIYFIVFTFCCCSIFWSTIDSGMIRLFSGSLFYFSSALFVLMLAFVILRYSRSKSLKFNLIFSKKIISNSNPKKTDSILVLLPLSFVCQYALLNDYVMNDWEKIEFITYYAIIFIFFLYFLPLLLSKLFYIVGLVPLTLSLSIIFAGFPVLVSLNHWYPGKPDLAFLFALLGIVFCLLSFLFLFKRSILIKMSAFVFIVNTSYTIFQSDLVSIEEPRIIDYENFIPTGPMKKKPNIFMLTYDSYVGQETMQQYGIDNISQEEYLLERGFKIYPQTYSIKSGSRGTISRILEMSSTIEQEEVYSTAGHALAPSILEKYGYHTYGILTPYLLASPYIGDKTSFPNLATGPEAIYAGLESGEFSFDLVAKTSKYTHQDFINEKRKIFVEKSETPKFVYTHTGPGHSQNSGKCLSNEIELFEQRLKVANREMKEDIESILSIPSDAIIIVHGDHGPYLTGNCLNLSDDLNEITRLALQDSYGTFLAIRWPDEDYKDFDNIRTLQDLFESVFKFLYQSPNVLLKRVPPVTLAMGTKYVRSSVPDGAVIDGKIQIGVNSEEVLFEGADKVD